MSADTSKRWHVFPRGWVSSTPEEIAAVLEGGGE